MTLMPSPTDSIISLSSSLTLMPGEGSESTPTLSVQEDSRKDRIRRRVSRTKRKEVKKRKLAKLDKIGMSIERCIDVPNRLMLPG